MDRLIQEVRTADLQCPCTVKDDHSSGAHCLKFANPLSVDLWDMIGYPLFKTWILLRSDLACQSEFVAGFTIICRGDQICREHQYKQTFPHSIDLFWLRFSTLKINEFLIPSRPDCPRELNKQPRNLEWVDEYTGCFDNGGPPKFHGPLRKISTYKQYYIWWLTAPEFHF